MKSPVSVLIKTKGNIVHTVDATQTVLECVEKMNINRVGAVLVKEKDKLVGIFTERDVLKRVVGEHRDPKATLVSAVMTKDFQTIESQTTVEQAMRLMTKFRFRHLPVIDGDKLQGLISIGDITRWVLEQQSNDIDALVKYING